MIILPELSPGRNPAQAISQNRFAHRNKSRGKGQAMSREIRPCRVAQSERRQPARRPIRFPGRKYCHSVRTSLILAGYGGRPCPAFSRAACPFCFLPKEVASIMGLRDQATLAMLAYTAFRSSAIAHCHYKIFSTAARRSCWKEPLRVDRIESSRQAVTQRCQIGLQEGVP
jgi:hypothetical protein